MMNVIDKIPTFFTICFIGDTCYNSKEKDAVYIIAAVFLRVEILNKSEHNTDLYKS